jgi:hypothetical protein
MTRELQTFTKTGAGTLADAKPKRPAKRLRLRLSPGKAGDYNPLALLNWQPRKADKIWTCSEWANLCEHLHNDNERTHFVMGFSRDGEKQYVRSKRWGVDRAISWSWSSITGTARNKLAFSPYSTNDRQQSRWGGLDFDAHNGETGRARELAFAAFRCLLNTPDLCVILETSGGGGWHVWAISCDFHDTCEWLRLIKSVVSFIGTTIAAGVCEIYPPDSLPSRFGKGMRAPGCWNPGSNTLSEIVWENTHTSLESVLSGKSKTRLLTVNKLQKHFPDRERSISLLSSSVGGRVSLYHVEDWVGLYGITRAGHRNSRLTEMTGAMFHQVGHAMAGQLALAQYRRKTAATKTSEQKHLDGFEKSWAGLAGRWLAALSATEREIFNRLETENERDAFRIVRSYAMKAAQDGAADFPIARDNLAERLGVSGKGAAWIRNKLAKLGVIAKTADYVPNKFAARFKWLLTIMPCAE